jgi:hypothetical protein
MIPLGKAKVVRPGTHLTVVTYGAVVQRTLVAAKEVEEQNGISVEVIDLRSLSPIDWPTIAASVQKTNKVIIAYEDALSWGYGAELAARIADECFAWLDAPVKRVASTDTFVAYSPVLEDHILPQAEDLAHAMRERAFKPVLGYTCFFCPVPGDSCTSSCGSYPVCTSRSAPPSIRHHGRGRHMGGLGLEDYLLGGRDRHPAPRRCMGDSSPVGLFGFLSPFVLGLARQAYIALARGLPEGR